MFPLLILMFFLLSSQQAGAVSNSSLTRVLSKYADSAEQSVAIIRVRDGKLLFSYNKDKALIPASVTKLVTSAAAIKLWGPNHTFKTKMFYTGRKSGGQIYGDLFIKGDGDPFLISEKLWQMASDLRNLGLKNVKGDLILDQSLFDKHGERKEGRYSSNNAYDAPVSALGVNFNTFEVMISPSQKLGSTALVSLSPYSIRNVSIKNNVKTVNTNNSLRPKVKRISNKNGSATLIASGSIGVASLGQKVYRSVNDPGLSSGEIIRAFLEREGIKIDGLVKEGTVPSSSSHLYTIEGYTVGKIIDGLNNFSNNYIGDVLVKRMGAAFKNKEIPDRVGSGTYENGIDVLLNFLDQHVRSNGKFILENGSGLSVNNRLSAELIAKLLSEISADLGYFPEFLASLPTSGKEGTLKNRFKSPLTRHLVGRVRAKTGTLSQPVSVSSLAGYINHKDHGMLAFAIIQNGRGGKKQPNILDLRFSQEKILVKTLSSL